MCVSVCVQPLFLDLSLSSLLLHLTQNSNLQFTDYTYTFFFFIIFYFALLVFSVEGYYLARRRKLPE